MGSTGRFGIFIRNESEIIQAICRKKILTIEVVNKIKKETKGYCLLQNCYECYMIFCLVNEEVQKSLIYKNEVDAVENQILWNAVVLVQGLWFIENRLRFSPTYDRVTGNSINGLNHLHGFTGFGVDDFKSADKRKTSIFKWFEQKCLTDDANMFFHNVEQISRLMDERYNELRKNFFPQLSIEKHMVTYQSRRRKQKITTCSTNIFTLLYHLSPLHNTMPLWFNKSLLKLFSGSDCEFDKRDFSKSINEHPNDSEKKLCNAISKRISTNTEKTKTDGELNFEMAATKTVTAKPQMEYEK
jgi:hypothetical protein